MARSALFTNRGNTPDDYLVTDLPGLTKNIPEDDRPLMHAGQLEVFKENNTHYFFWRFADQNKAPEAENRTIFWLNGGPGCSSMDGALMESGPLRIDKNKDVVYNHGSWHKKGDLVFVDQPAGTGFSYTDTYDSELYQISYAFMVFLKKYFEVFPEDRHNEISLAGESYAGQYIPYIASAILAHNKDAEEDDKFNLKGLLIGNGWISPNVQSLSYIPFAVQAGMISTSHPNWQAVLDQHLQCQKLVAGTSDHDTFGQNRVVDTVCENVLSALLRATRDKSGDHNQECFNMYDYTLKDLYPSCGMNWPPDLEVVNPFLQSEKVMSQLNIEHKILWHECDSTVSRHFRTKNLQPSITLFPALLLEIPIVLFHGNRDVICNYIGAEDMIKDLEWGSQKGYSEDVTVYDWVHNDSVLGYIKSERNLTFINVFEASHMVPFDKPEVSRALIDILYSNVETRAEEGKKPQMVTRPFGYKDTTVSDGTESESGSDESSQPLSSAADADKTASDANKDEQSHTSRTMRLIQLAVIVVLVWGLCALYNTYKSKPTSIIKTKPSGRKKNVQWADQLVDEGDAEAVQPESFILKALHKFKGTDGYATVARDDIEMGNVEAGDDDDFIIASDDEEPHPRTPPT